MPLYCYLCDACGCTASRLSPAARRSAGPCPVCGSGLRRDWSAEHRRGRRAGTGDLRSVAAGVVPEQAADAERRMAERGIDGVRFDRRTGDAIFAGRAAKLRAIRAMGLHDRDEVRG